MCIRDRYCILDTLSIYKLESVGGTPNTPSYSFFSRNVYSKNKINKSFIRSTWEDSYPMSQHWRSFKWLTHFNDREEGEK